MHDQTITSITRAILHALPTAVIALDSNDTVIIANMAASRLVDVPRERLEGGSISRFVSPNTEFTSAAKNITFTALNSSIDLIAVAKEVIVEDSAVKVILLKNHSTNNDNVLIDLIATLSNTDKDPYEFICEALVRLKITKDVCVRSVTPGSIEVLATTSDVVVFQDSPVITRSISSDEFNRIELVLIPDKVHGLTRSDLSTIDMLISLLHLRVDTLENATDASGSETALALALKAGDMGMCFFDTNKSECYLSDRLATWCGINPDTFEGSLQAWLDTFAQDDSTRVKTLFAELADHKKFKTVVNVHTLEQDLRLELFGRPLHENNSHEWVAIARPYRDEQEVEAAWQTRISMEEAARIDAEAELEHFEHSLIETLLPTTSDVAIVHSRQEAGTWHIARQFGNNTFIYCVGAVVSNDRKDAVVGATLVATMADVLASEVDDVNHYVELIRDHARARDIETSIAGVKVIHNHLESASHGGASTFISGKSFNGVIEIDSTTALSISSHSQASADVIDVAANGRPWKIMSTVIEVLSLKDADSNNNIDEPDRDESLDESQNEIKDDIDLNDLTQHDNVSPFRSGSIYPT